VVAIFQITSLTNTPFRTCFFALGLVSSTPQGAEILEDYGWEATLSPLGLPTGLCIPADIEKFLSVRFPQVPFRRGSGLYVLFFFPQIPSWDVTPPKKNENRLKPPASENEIEVMTAVSNLANTVIANTASRALAKYVSPGTREHRADCLFVNIQDERPPRVPTNIRVSSGLLQGSPYNFDAEIQAPGPAVHL